MPRAGKGMGRDTVQGHENAGNLKQRPDEADLANERHGHNKLQGDDQEKVRNERRSWPDSQ